MKLSELRELLRDKRVIEEINKHLWIESQKSGYSIGIERATDEWLRLYADGWLKYNKPGRISRAKKKKKAVKVKKAAKKAKKAKRAKTAKKKSKK